MKSDEKLCVVNEIGVYGSLDVKDPTANPVPLNESARNAKIIELLDKGYTMEQINEAIKNGII